jgi:catechol 2,3-dioxygenase-like lactoylglutathione lyase family enzyme
VVTRLGYVRLRVPDVAASAEFLQATLGLREVERVNGCVYLTCSERHHELVLAPGEKVAYEHIGLEVSDAQALGETPEAGG